MEERNGPVFGPPTRQEVTEKIDEFSRLRKLGALGTYVDPARKLEALMRATHHSPESLVVLGKEGIVELLRCTYVTRRNEFQKTPHVMATRMLMCVKILKEDNPTSALPDISDPRREPKIPLVLLCNERPQFTADRRAWVKQFSQEASADCEVGKAIETTTPLNYVRAIRTLYSVAVTMELVADDSFGILAMSSTDIFQLTIDRLDTLYESASVASIAAGLLRVAIDLYGNDDAHADCLKRLRGEVARRFPSLALDDKALKELVDFLDDEHALPTLLNAHRLIEARAGAKGLKPRDRVGRTAAALACILKLTHPALEADQLAKLSLKTHFKNGRQIRLPDLVGDKTYRWEDLEPESVRLVQVLKQVKLEHGDDSPLLFPAYDGTARKTRVAMRLLYDEIEQVLGRRVDCQFLKDLNTLAGLTADPDAVPQIAQGAGYKDPRSLARRMAAVVNARRK